MSKTIKAGVVVVHRFVDKSSPKAKGTATFAGYIDYIDRDDAVRTENFTKYNLSSQFGNYNDYMANPEKSTGLFTATSDALDAGQTKALKAAFQKSFDNDNIMWQTVISFDNRYLAQLGVYDPETGVLDEGLLRRATRAMMRDVLEKENMQFSAVWSAAIHYNTDNIHVHVAYTEPTNSRKMKEVDGVERPRGYFSAKTMRSMKSKVVGFMVANEYTEFDRLIRDRFVAGIMQNFTPGDKKLRGMWFQIYDNLPTDKRQWFYNMNGMEPLRPLLDDLSLHYLKENHAEEYNALRQALARQQDLFATAYGTDKAQHYAENKLNDMYVRMGNAILSEMRHYAKSPYSFIERAQRYTEKSTTYNLANGLRQALRRAFGDIQKQNLKEYQQLQAELCVGE